MHFLLRQRHTCITVNVKTVWISLVLAFLRSMEARELNIPILSGESYQDLSALKVEDTYYVITSTLNTTNGIFPIFTSTDLVEWKPADYVFNDENLAGWASHTHPWSPYIQQIGTNYLLYFSSYKSSNSTWYIGVATAASPLGPYKLTDEPIVTSPEEKVFSPSIMNDEGKLFLLWTTEENYIYARQLKKDGLTFSSTGPKLYLPGIKYLDVSYPRYIRRENYHYLMFSDQLCSGIVAARSKQALRPYETLAQLIVFPDNKFSCPKDFSIVKDLDDSNDVILFNAFAQIRSVIVLDSVTWNGQGWPQVGNYHKNLTI